MIAITKDKGTSQDTDGIVVPLLAPSLVRIRDPVEHQVANLQEQSVAELWAPNASENSSIRSECDARKIVPVQAYLAVFDELIENLVACSYLRRIDDFVQIAKVRKLILKTECAHPDSLFDSFELLTRSPQACLRGQSYQGGPISHAVHNEIELNSSLALCGYSADSHSFSAHSMPLNNEFEIRQRSKGVVSLRWPCTCLALLAAVAMPLPWSIL